MMFFLALYQVIVTDSNGCKGISPVINHILTTSDFLTVGNITIYPNPVTDILNIALNTVHDSYDIKVTDMNGRKFIQKNYGSVNGNQHIMVDLRSIPPGIYLVTISNKLKISTIRIMKE